MGYGTKVSFETIREVAAGDVGASYAALGSAVSDHVRLLRITNTCNAEVYVSFDGVNNHLRMGSGSFVLFDFTSNKVRDDGLFLSEGTVFYIKRVSGAATTGALWIEVIYASGGV